MKVIILAGGWGTRLGNITTEIPKPMVMIGNKPIIWHIMNIYSKAGFNDFIICLGVKGQIIKNYFKEYDSYSKDFSVNLENKEITYFTEENLDWNVSLIDTGLNTPKGGRIKMTEKYLDDINMVTYGDSLIDLDINKLIEFHNSHNKLITITGVSPPARFGEIGEENNVIKTFKEKPKENSNIINGGFMVFKKELLDYLDYDSELETDVFEKLTKKEEVMVYKHDGEWECMDHERDVIYLNKLLEEGNAFW